MEGPNPAPNPSDASATPTFVSLYSGAGGLDAGFIGAGFEPMWANDYDATAVATYNRNIDGHHAVAGPIEEVRDHMPARGTVDLVIGGPPCQGFSVAGHMRDNDPRSKHVWTFLDVVDELQPQAFVMENVKALAATRRWRGLAAELLQRARDLKYEADIFVLNAAHYEVPQRRERMFLIGMRGATPKPPPPRTAERPPTVRETLDKLPAYGTPGNDTLCTAIVTPAKRPVLRRSPYAGLLLNGKGRILELDAPALTLPATMGGNRTHVIDQDHLEGGADWVVEYHERLMAGRPPVHAVPAGLRRLTVEEAAAIQSFRRGWRFEGRLSAQFRQIGNAVPPRLGYWVAHHVKSQLWDRTSSGSPGDKNLAFAA
jgi:DNA (cytosine-5)-methyltransferase 1